MWIHTQTKSKIVCILFNHKQHLHYLFLYEREDDTALMNSPSKDSYLKIHIKNILLQIMVVIFQQPFRIFLMDFRNNGECEKNSLFMFLIQFSSFIHHNSDLGILSICISLYRIITCKSLLSFWNYHSQIVKTLPLMF